MRTARWVPIVTLLVTGAFSADGASPVYGTDHKPLPLIEVAQQHGKAPARFAVMLSGDGGWAPIDREISRRLVAAGVPVVGLNALEYFWTRRNPDVLARDLAAIITTYQSRWNVRQVILAGYSRGADVLPFAASRLPAPVRKDVALVALLSPSRTANFEFRVTDWFAGRAGVATAPEIAKLAGMHLLCVYGSDDKESVCPAVDRRIARVVPLEGAHHFDGNYDAVAALILGEAAR